MRTPRSITTRVSRALRPTKQSGSTTASSSMENEFTRAPVKISDLRSFAPEMMQSPATSDETADPRLPSSSWTNFAGGLISA